MARLEDVYDQASELFPNKRMAQETADKIFNESKKSAKSRLEEYLGDTISEFVDTNCLTGEEFYEVLVDCVFKNWEYYQRNANCNKYLLDRLKGKASSVIEEYSKK